MRQVEMNLMNLRVSHEKVLIHDMNASSYALIEGGSTKELTRQYSRSTEEASRQYSLEDEYLLSSKYPR
jgi:hypothetical protein